MPSGKISAGHISEPSRDKKLQNGRSPRRLLFLLDFDGTITTEDTLDALISSAGEVSSLSAETRISRWEFCKEAYMSDLQAHNQKHFSTKLKPNSMEAELRDQSNREEVEKRSVDRISEARLLEGVVGEKGVALGRRALRKGRVDIRKGFVRFIDAIQRFGRQELVVDGKSGMAKWGIISVNWSEAWIRGIVEESLRLGRKETMGESLEVLNVELGVWCNEFDAQGKTVESWSLSTPNLPNNRLILTGWDKLAIMRLIIEDQVAALYPTPQVTSVTPQHTDLKLCSSLPRREEVVYIGDSLTDLSCLSSADIGICIWQEEKHSSLRDFMDCADLKLRHISMYRVSGENQDCKEMFWASDFEEIVESGICGLIMGESNSK